MNTPTKHFLNIAISLLVWFAPGFVSADAMKDAAKRVADAAFSEAERQAIEKYYEATEAYRGKRHEDDDEDEDDDDDDDDRKYGGKNDKGKKGKDKSARKSKKLPKGIVKKLERGGTLPPGMERRGLPQDLEDQLPPAPEGYERVKTEGKVVLVDAVTGVISDMIKLGKKREDLKTGQKQGEMTDVRTESKQTEKAESVEKPEKKWWQIWKD